MLMEDEAHVQADGWYVPSTSKDPVPIPVSCQPIFESKDATQVWCAVGIDLNGTASLDRLNQQLIESYHQMIDEPYLKLSSMLWIAAKSQDTAMITIVDSNEPEKAIDRFPLGNAILYAMGSVPGSSSTDSPLVDDSQRKDSANTRRRK